MLQMKTLTCVLLAASAIGCNGGDQPAVPPTAPAADQAPAMVQASPAGASTETPAPTQVEPWTAGLEGMPRTELCSLDAVDGTGAVNGAFKLSAEKGATFEGWAATAGMATPPKVLIYLDGPQPVRLHGVTGQPRPDVAEAVGAGLANSGFSIAVPVLHLATGEYGIWVGHEADGVSSICETRTRLIVR